MAEKILYEYSVLRYVADIEREEFVNIGLLMMSKRHRWIQSRLHIDDKRIGTMFPAADTERLRRQLQLFTRNDVPYPGLAVEERYRWMAAVKSAVIQTSPSHPGIIIIPETISRKEICECLNAQFEQLFRRLVL